MKNFKIMIVVALAGFLLNACSEGPAEKTGKEIDNAVTEAQDNLQNKGPMQKAGEKADEATGH
ncbi:MAG: hypothetical protein NTW08_10000 [Gammaproteobacteria bacterium]|nr:hypothetical protein [Gammaproteobacteria bacterium]